MLYSTRGMFYLKRITIIAVCILAVVFLSYGYMDSYTREVYLQKNADQLFTTNFSLICANIAVDTSTMDDEQLISYNNQNAEYGYMITNIFSLTSYADNSALNQIVRALDQITGSDAIYHVEIDAGLQEKLLYLSHNLHSAETIDSVWESLSSYLV